MRVFCVFFCFFRAKIWPAAAGTGELARDLRDQTPDHVGHEAHMGTTQGVAPGLWQGSAACTYNENF